MTDQAELDLTKVPRRFWTPEMIAVAQAQGQFETAAVMAETLLSQASGTNRKELEQLASTARAGIITAKRRVHLLEVKKKLEQCLKRAHAFKKKSPSIQ